MNFSPYHNFDACNKFEKTIEDLHARGKVPPKIYDEYLKYHFSLMHKLKSARHHIENLDGYLNSQNAQQANPKDLVYTVNFNFDGFLYVLGSALDILAREVLCYYNLLPSGNVYFTTAHQQVQASRPTDSILPLLVTPTWKNEFSTYRNSATHELVISTNYQVDVKMIGSKVVKRIVFPLPDNPRAATLLYKNNKDIVVYCTSTFKRTLSLMNVIYSHIEKRAKASDSLPI